ncbi:L-seryl-tRNA(Sec) selenium transferase [Salibacterium halotolerans]|uniref:L-seryl-tRNA(Sec) selenium transferase n=1 Tax=Salibacterium halotolerans TaxID=1884432 RepID=A0A1I5UVC4_9BACI|nr:L-seryl-tRNA(Sec) selenium transferase [Salibacterium halotolerans]SFP98666.1 L-seryl-tRNA(Ser) seleniumtransferase [Salibacterium halotolerans]
MKEKLRWIPPVHEMQNKHRFLEMKQELGNENLLTDWLRLEMNRLREEWLHETGPDLSSQNEVETYLLQQVSGRFESFRKSRLKQVINATGTILHTNLGRANMSDEAVKKAAEAAAGYSSLEYDISSGGRGSRHDILEDLIQTVTGAEAAMVVNNNAAAVYMVLKALAKKREVIVSRGQLVEIGGSFRVSSIMEESGAALVEVGTTNKTHRRDYEQAVGPDTAMLMKVHTSNFKTIGFTEEVPLSELTEVAAEQQQDMIVYEDLGSGALYDFKEHGIGSEPTVKEALATGADLVTFSGDKLLGGPQAGIIAGRKKWIDRLKKHQLARVLRVDKMTIAALEETLKAYAGNRETEIPAVRMVLETKEEVKRRAEIFLNSLQLSTWKAAVEDEYSRVGGGTMPEVELPTAAAAITPSSLSAEEAAACLRTYSDPPIAVRVKHEKILVDLRTLTEEEMKVTAEALSKIEKMKELQ